MKTLIWLLCLNKYTQSLILKVSMRYQRQFWRLKVSICYINSYTSCTSFWFLFMCSTPVLYLIFTLIDHQNFFGIDENFGPVAISIRREKLEDRENKLGKAEYGQYQHRIIFRTSAVSLRVININTHKKSTYLSVYE